MAFLRTLAKALRKIWTFITTMIYIASGGAIAFLIASVITPENVSKAIEIVKGIFL